jgi:hypothetical protein
LHVWKSVFADYFEARILNAAGVMAS